MTLFVTSLEMKTSRSGMLVIAAHSSILLLLFLPVISEKIDPQMTHWVILSTIVDALKTKFHSIIERENENKINVDNFNVNTI